MLTYEGATINAKAIHVIAIKIKKGKGGSSVQSDAVRYILKNHTDKDITACDLVENIVTQNMMTGTDLTAKRALRG